MSCGRMYRSVTVILRHRGTTDESIHPRTRAASWVMIWDVWLVKETRLCCSCSVIERN